MAMSLSDALNQHLKGEFLDDFFRKLNNTIAIAAADENGELAQKVIGGTVERLELSRPSFERKGLTIDTTGQAFRDTISAMPKDQWPSNDLGMHILKVVRENFRESAIMQIGDKRLIDQITEEKCRGFTALAAQIMKYEKLPMTDAVATVLLTQKSAWAHRDDKTPSASDPLYIEGIAFLERMLDLSIEQGGAVTSAGKGGKAELRDAAIKRASERTGVEIPK